MKTLYKNADVLIRENNDWHVLKNAYLGVDDTAISFLSVAEPQEKFDEVVDLRSKLVIPGLYNCHTHAAMVLLRGVGSDLPLDRWLFGSVIPIEDKIGEKEILAGTELAMLEMLACGTVSFSDMYFEPHITARAVKKAGMKANLSRPVQAFDPKEAPEDNRRVKEALQLYADYNGYADGRVLIDFSLHAEYTCNPEVVHYFSSFCKEKKGNMHIHLSETVKEHEECKARYGKTPAKWFADLGAFDSRAFAAHCVALEDSDIHLLKDKGISVAHCPSSNMKLGSGFAPVERFLEEGINVTIGTDGAASNNNLNMFEEMHLAGIVHNGFLRDATVIKAGEVLDMATINGARLQGRENCGELKVGNRADFVVIDTDKPHLTPCLDVPALLVYSAQGSDVIMTVVDGKVLYKDGEYLTIDRERVMYDVQQTIRKLYC